MLMRCVLAERPAAAKGFELVSFERWNPDVLEIHRSLGRELPEARLRQRFTRGLRWYVLQSEGASLAATWAVAAGERFVDELALGFPVSDGAHWWRDIFVAPAARGRGVFTALLDGVLARDFPATREMWSMVYQDNRPSMRAHEKRGFVPVCEYDVLRILDRLALRLRWPRTRALGSAYQPERRLVWTGAQYRRFIADRLA